MQLLPLLMLLRGLLSSWQRMCSYRFSMPCCCVPSCLRLLMLLRVPVALLQHAEDVEPNGEGAETAKAHEGLGQENPGCVG